MSYAVLTGQISGHAMTTVKFTIPTNIPNFLERSIRTYWIPNGTSTSSAAEVCILNNLDNRQVSIANDSFDFAPTGCAWDRISCFVNPPATVELFVSCPG